MLSMTSHKLMRKQFKFIKNSFKEKELSEVQKNYENFFLTITLLKKVLESEEFKSEGQLQTSKETVKAFLDMNVELFKLFNTELFATLNEYLQMI